MIFLLLAIAVIPPLILLLIVWVADRIEKESKLVVSGLFLLGSVSCIPIALMENILAAFNVFPEGSILHLIVENFFVVAICEEGGKFLILFLCTWWYKKFDYKYDALVYSTAISLGFATLENICYVILSSIQTSTIYGVSMEYKVGYATSILRMLLAIPAHFSFSIIMGYFYGFAKMNANKKKTGVAFGMIVLCLSIPIFCHGFYDFGLSTQNPIFVILSIALSLFMDITTIILIISSVKRDVMIRTPQVQHSFIYRYSPQFQNYYQYGYNNIQNQQRPIQQNMYQQQTYNQQYPQNQTTNIPQQPQYTNQPSQPINQQYNYQYGNQYNYQQNNRQ